jgi:hypothetical protein
MNTLQRALWNGGPEPVRQVCHLTKPSGAQATLTVWTHIFGWEVRLLVNDSLVRSQVTRNRVEADTTAREWHIAMLNEGWIAQP